MIDDVFKFHVEFERKLKKNDQVIDEVDFARLQKS